MSPSEVPDAVLFDLDGTLVQTRASSWRVFRGIAQRYDLPVSTPEEYYALFRGNVFTAITELCRDAAQGEAVKKAFLEALRSEYAPPMVPGMADVARRLASHCTVAVMSSNATDVVRRVLTDNHLAYCFSHVFGGDLTPRKGDAIAAFLAESGGNLRRLCTADYDEETLGRPADPARTVLVTDTAGDVRDGLAEGIRVVGVSWGMHPAQDLLDAGAEFVALWPQEVAAHLLGGAAVEPLTGACAVPPPAPVSARTPRRSATVTMGAAARPCATCAGADQGCPGVRGPAAARQVNLGLPTAPAVTGARRPESPTASPSMSPPIPMSPSVTAQEEQRAAAGRRAARRSAPVSSNSGKVPAVSRPASVPAPAPAAAGPRRQQVPAGRTSAAPTPARRPVVRAPSDLAAELRLILGRP
ncbi:MAG: HAD hydrolase-like protein [Janthinobacterium lividum]